MAPIRPDKHRLERLIAALETHFPPNADSERVEIVRAPCRVNLMGDHTDYSEGYVLPAAISLDTWLAFRRRRDGQVRVASMESPEPASFWIDDLDPDPASAGTRRWSDYVAGAAWSLREAALPIRGFDGVVDTAMPLGVGFASSSALELASALALLGAGRVMPPPALAALAQRAEREYVGVNSGIADQFAVAAGREGRALLLDCRSLESRHVPMPYGIRVVVCDTGMPRPVQSKVFAERRAECARALALLSERLPGLCSLRDLDPASLKRHRANLPDNVARRAEHVISENARVLATSVAMDHGDLDEIGRLFTESHLSLRDLFEVGAPQLDAMVQVAGAVPGVIAARATGMGLGGCTVNLVLADAVAALKTTIAREYDRRTGLRSRVYAVDIVDGAGPLAVTA